MSDPTASNAAASGSLLATEQRSTDLELAIAARPSAFRVLTGDRPTGPLHIGHYFGTLENRVRLQDAGVDLLVLIADYQVMTDRTITAGLAQDVLGQVADYLAVGIDPGRATIFAHSQVEALNQLLLPFLSLVSVAEVGRNPTVKDEMAAAGSAVITALMFSYPVHQAADILFCHANVVPVGKDQLPHVELTRSMMAAMSPSAFSGLFGPLLAFDVHRQIHAIDLPTHVVVGSRDMGTPPRLARAIVEQIPGAELTVYPGCGHMVMLERADEFCDLLRRAAG